VPLIERSRVISQSCAIWDCEASLPLPNFALVLVQGHAHVPLHLVTDADNALRRTVTMAYRTARDAGCSHHHALELADAVYFQAHPEELGDRLEASARIDAMITSAINSDPRWFWKNMCALIDADTST
jgi:hypothetical protein